MLESIPPEFRQIVIIAVAAAAISLVLALLLLIWVVISVRRIELPPNAGFFTALRSTPFVVVLVLDLLDFSLDFFSLPIAWVLLSYLNLKPLRAVSAFETVIPGTQLLPTMTVAWILARFMSDEQLPKL